MEPSNSSDNVTLDTIVALAKRRGFIFPGSEIYGGFAGTYDFGPMGVALRKNITDLWMRSMLDHDNIAALDSSIVTSGKVWEASGHVSGFSDPLVICNACHTKHRADHLLEAIGVAADEKMTEQKLNDLFDAHRTELICPHCGKKDFGRITAKNLLATTNLGMFEEGDEQVYLRGETAQGIFINFKNILDTGSYAVPFGIAQIGKAFRNEISPRQFLFRKREFEQMEMQYFVPEAIARDEFEKWKEERMAFHISLGINPEHLHFKQHENLVFYAKDAFDIEYDYPFGRGELEGVHYRGDYDLSQHQKFSGVDLSVYDEETKERFVPHVIETSVGVDRLMLAVLADAYSEDEMNGDKRVVLRFSPKVAPVKAMVAPLLKNKPELVAKAREVRAALQKVHPAIAWDDNGNIGKRYRRQDEIGTPFCITIDFDTLGENPDLLDTVTLRHRDSGEQERVSIAEAAERIRTSL
jgi:glycyl-tRNA synthetase